jgi:PHD/YefM family antitoxin component YafN of YafNO toxin-antitoxin module
MRHLNAALITNNETLAVLLPEIEWSAEQLLITIEEWRQSLASNR